MNAWKIFLPLVFALGVISPANATLVFNNGYGTSNLGGLCASCGSAGTYTQIDDFTLGASYSTLVFEWDASFFHANTTSIQLGIWQSENSTQLFSKTINFADLDSATVNVQGMFGGWQPSQNITVSYKWSGLNLGAGTYWLSLSGDDMHFDESLANQGNGSQIEALTLGRGVFGGMHTLSTPFRVYDGIAAVPLPSSIVLFTSVVVSLFSKRRFFRK